MPSPGGQKRYPNPDLDWFGNNPGIVGRRVKPITKKRGYGYQASATASLFNIVGKRPKTITGLGLRPIVISRSRKKKSKKRKR